MKGRQGESQSVESPVSVEVEVEVEVILDGGRPCFAQVFHQHKAENDILMSRAWRQGGKGGFWQAKVGVGGDKADGRSQHGLALCPCGQRRHVRRESEQTRKRESGWRNKLEGGRMSWLEVVSATR